MLAEDGAVKTMDAGGATLLRSFPETLNPALFASLGATSSEVVTLDDVSSVRITLSLAHQPDPGASSYFAILEPVAAAKADPFERVAQAAELTAREREVAELAIQGLGNKGIAHRLGISPVTVGVHLSSTYKKAGVSGRVELTRVMSRP